MRAILFRAALVALAATATSAAQADDSITSNVTNVFVQTGTSVGLFSMTTMPSNMPGCDTGMRFAFDMSKTEGQAMFAAVETALVTHRPIQVVGNGACDTWGDSETVRYMVAQ